MQQILSIFLFFCYNMRIFLMNMQLIRGVNACKSELAAI